MTHTHDTDRLEARAAYLLALAKHHARPELAPAPVHTRFCATVACHRAHGALSATLANQRARQILQAGPQAHTTTERQ
jgi:hypothetical protein